MTQFSPSKSVTSRAAMLTLGLLFATACSNAPSVPTSANPGLGSYSLTVTTQPNDTPQGLERRYGGEVIVWRPEEGFAVVKTDTAPANDAAVTGIDRNQGTIKAPVVVSLNRVPLIPQGMAQSENVWMGGWTAWSGGWTSWSGGWSAWGGGSSTVPSLPSENSAVFGLIRLQQAHQASRNFGAGVKVAVIDTGLDTTHPMFQGRLAPQSEWKDFVDGDANPQEVGTTADRGYGHGTGVAGIIVQVAPRVTILPLRVLDKGGMGDLDKIVQAIDWAVQKGANVINLSLGSDQNQTSLTSVLQFAASRGVYVVASAGNDGVQDGVTFPARLTYSSGMDGFMFGIGSMNNQDILSSFTNYSYDLFASGPGENIYSAFPVNRTAAFTGTSFAAPLYTGAIALGLRELPTGTDARAFRSYLMNSMRAGDLWQDNLLARGTDKLGNGRLNVENLIRNLPGFTPKVAYGATNFVQNGGFEAGNLSNWRVTSWTTPSVVTGNASSGSFALRLNPGDCVEQTITNLRANTTYTLSAMIRNSTNDDGGVNIGVFNHGGQQSFLEVRGTTFTRRFVTFTTGPTNTSATVELHNWIGNAVTAFFDDVTLRQTGY